MDGTLVGNLQKTLALFVVERPFDRDESANVIHFAGFRLAIGAVLRVDLGVT